MVKHFHAPDGRLVVCLNAATQSSALTRGYTPVDCTSISLLSQLNDLDAVRARAAAAAAGGGTRRPPPPQSGAAPGRPAAAPGGRDGAVPGSASAAPRVTPSRAEAAASASVPDTVQPAARPQQPNAPGGDPATRPIPDADFVVERAKLLGEPGKVDSAQFQVFQGKLRICVEEEVRIDDATVYAPILAWKGVKTYKSKPFRTEALQIHTFLCIRSRVPAADDARLEDGTSYTWSDLRNRARAYGQKNDVSDWAAALRTCIQERTPSGGEALSVPASEPSAE